MGFQEIIVTAIGILVLLYLARRIYCMISRKDFSACYGCDKNCPMKKKKRKR
ncbi:MAG: hypothetical protein IKU59_01630 [Bacteroidales bacterium]|nr:hypothetical protein [Bacteroidales bacterium]